MIVRIINGNKLRKGFWLLVMISAIVLYGGVKKTCFGQKKIFLAVDSLSIDNYSFDKVLMIQDNKKIKEVYRLSIEDHSSEFSEGCYYKDKVNEYKSFHIEDFTVGWTRSIYFNFLDSMFYITDKYTSLSLEGSVDFSGKKVKGVILEQPNCGKTEDIRLEILHKLSSSKGSGG